jgi:aminopeptidase N
MASRAGCSVCMLVEMLLRRGLLALGLVFAGGASAWAQRLPNGVRPKHYALTITPDLAKARFAGTERIEVVLDKPASAITLNAAEIEFGAVRAWAGQGSGPGQQQIPFGNDKQTAAGAADKQKAAGAADKQTADGGASSHDRSASVGHPDFPDDAQTAVVTLDAKSEQATLTFARPLPAGTATLEIAYTGVMSDKLRGFYLSKTKLRNYGVTQFEATDARRAFPCFDEPALKATFEVTLVIDAGDTAISNTKMVRNTPGPVPGKHTVAFAPTPLMSTYLVAWLVGDFQCTEGKSDGVPIRACATPDKVALTKFALDAAKWDLHYYDDYFGIKYPLQKLDIVAIPDFEEGAMENFGCITFREAEMLVNSKNGSLEAEKNVATTVAHEIAHQWFGDLVTPAWWDNLWLNEGFATWMETKAADKWKPKWEYPQDVALDKNHTMDSDAGRTTRAIRTKAETPAEIEELFDDIAYGKAGSVIAMVENWVGDTVFRKGVQAYLSAHLYGNAGAEDFWDAQTRVSGLPVDKVMRSFVEQPGVPLVTLGAPAYDGKAAMNGEPGTAVAQRRFFLSDGAADAGAAWIIPVCFSGSGCRLLTPEIKTMDAPSGVYANAMDKGYYRTAYAPAELKAIEATAETRLNVPERIGLLGDRWALLRGGQGTVGEFLDLVLAVKADSSPRVAEMALGKIDAIEKKIASDEDRTRMNAVVRREFAPIYASLGNPKHESAARADLRGMLFDELGEAQDPAVIAEAQTVTQQLLAGQKPADPRIADAAVALATQKGDSVMYDRMMKVAQNSGDPDLKEAALNALTRFQDPLLVIRTLEYAVSDAVRNQDSWMLIALLLERRETQDLAWQFVEQHWAEIAKKSTASSGVRIVEAAGAFCTAEKRDAVTSFFAAHPVVSSQRTLAKAVESINECIHVRAVQEPELRRWLDAQMKP